MLMKGGGKNMKLLKADSDLGYFLTNDGKYRPIDEIKKQDLLRLVRSVLEEDSEFDEYDENIIKNQAHQIVYKSIFRNLQSLKGRRQEFIDESERLYLEDYKRYAEDAPQPVNSADPKGRAAD